MYSRCFNLLYSTLPVMRRFKPRLRQITGQYVDLIPVMRSYKLELRQITVQLLIFFVALKFALLELFQNLKSKFHRRNILRHDQKWTAPLRRSRRIHTRKIALLRKIRKL